MANPAATIVIPCHNHGRFVADAVDSCLAQRDATVRVAVVDDGSNDGESPAACDACRSDRVTVIHQDNAGLPAARNRGAAEADTEYLAFLDADDWIDPGFVAKLAGAIDADPCRDEVSHAYCQEELTELGHGTWRVPEWDPILLMVTNLHPVTALVRRDRFEAVGGFDPSMTEGYEDWELWLKMAEQGWRGVRVREPLFFWRRHSQISMITEAVQRHETLYRGLIDRHRDLYDQHMEEVAIRMNVLMRRFDVNWIDETGYPIPLRALWGLRDEVKQANEARRQADAAMKQARRETQSAREHARHLQSDYESWTAVRLHHALHRFIDRLPGPVGRAGKGLCHILKRIVPGGNATSNQPETSNHG